VPQSRFPAFRTVSVTIDSTYGCVNVAPFHGFPAVGQYSVITNGVRLSARLQILFRNTAAANLCKSDFWRSLRAELPDWDMLTQGSGKYSIYITIQQRQGSPISLKADR